MLRVDPEPFETPFDRLTVLSNVEGLTAPREIEGRLLLPRSSRRGLNGVERSRGIQAQQKQHSRGKEKSRYLGRGDQK
jgi:prophage tail gpP-like protein